MSKRHSTEECYGCRFRGYGRKEEQLVHLRMAVASAFLPIVVIGLIVFFVNAIFPDKARAQEETPTKDYPATERGVCERQHDEHLRVVGATNEEVRVFCLKEGVTI